MATKVMSFLGQRLQRLRWFAVLYSAAPMLRLPSLSFSKVTPGAHSSPKLPYILGKSWRLSWSGPCHHWGKHASALEMWPFNARTRGGRNDDASCLNCPSPRLLLPCSSPLAYQGKTAAFVYKHFRFNLVSVIKAISP